MSFGPRIPNNSATPAPVVEKLAAPEFQTPGDPNSARKTAASGRSQLRVNRAPSAGLSIPASGGAGGAAGLNIPRL